MQSQNMRSIRYYVVEGTLLHNPQLVEINEQISIWSSYTLNEHVRTINLE